jgi:hypothetical protein
MRILLFALAAVSGMAQIQHLEMTFTGVNCLPCVESMPSRAQRIRGVVSAKVDAEKLILTLAPENRVRVEQIRDLIQQDGTKAIRVPAIEVIGTVENGTLRIPQHALPLELKSSKPLPSGAKVRIFGTIEDLKGPTLRLAVDRFLELPQ